MKMCVWNAGSTVLRGNVIVLNVHSRKEKIWKSVSQVSTLRIWSINEQPMPERNNKDGSRIP